MGYDAFISYSHAADSTLAPRLQDGLQRLAKPWWRRRALQVFRDDTGLTANPGLWTSIETAMDDSRWFVFLASPEAAASPWVKRELTHWLERNGADRLLPVVTGGTWIWDDELNDFDLSRSSAVPAVLAGVFAEEPRHVDMTWAHSEEQVDLRNARFRDQVAEVAAPVHGVGKEDIEGADVREHRRTMRWAWGAAAALLLLTALSILAGTFAVHKADEAAAQRDEASLQRIAAEQSAAEAEQQQQAAEEKQQEAVDAKADADKQRDIADTKTNEAVAAKNDAEEQRDIADTKTNEAVAAKNDADNQRDIANTKTNEAVAAKNDAEEQRDIADTKTNEALAAKNDADNQRSVAVAQGNLARSKASEALENLGEANRQKAEANRQKASAQSSQRKAESETAKAVASQRQTEQALASEKQAKDAEAAAKNQAIRSAEEARVAQKKAEKAAEDELRAREAESDARRSAETEALASASSAQAGQDGALSLLLGVEAARRGGNSTRAGAGAPTTSGDPVGSGAPVRVPFRAPGAATGRRALFEAVTAVQGGADSYRVDRYLPFPADMDDPPTFLWRPVVSPNGRYMAASEFADPYRGLRGPTATRVFVWDLESPTPSVRVLSGHTEQVVTLAFAGTGDTLVTQDVPFDLGTGAPTTRIWDVNTGEQLLERSATVFLDPTAQHIALQTFLTAEVEFVDARTGQVTAVQPGVLAMDPAAGVRSLGSRNPPYIELPFSRDGRYAYGHSGGRAVLWDLHTGGVLTTPLASPGALRSSTPSVAPGGSGLAVSVEDGSNLAFFDTATGVHLGSFPVSTGNIESLTWNQDGTRLAILDDRSVLLLLDMDADAQNGTWTANALQGEVGFDRSGRFLTITAPVPDPLLLSYATLAFEMATGRTVGLFDGQLVGTATGDGSSMYFLRNDATIAVVSPVNGRILSADERGESTYSVAASSDGRYLAASSRSGVRVWDLTTDASPVSAAAPAGITMGLEFVHGTDRLIGTGTGSTPVSWDLGRIGAGEQVGFVSPNATVFSDGRTVLEPIDDGTAIRFRNLSTGVTRPGPALLPGESVAYLLTGPEGGPLVANLTGGTAVVADSEGTTIGRVPGTVAAVSRDGSRLAVRRPGRRIAVLATADLRTEQVIPLDALPDDDITMQVDSVALDPTGSRLAATNATGTTVVWDVGSGAVLTTIEGTSADRISFPLWGLAFSPDGDRLVVKSPSNTVRMYATGGTPRWELVATQQLTIDYAGRVVFSPDGALIAVDGLFLLDGETLQPITTLLAGPGAVTRFTGDGRSLVTVASSGLEGPDEFREVTEWTVSTDVLSTEACRIAGRDLTVDEWRRHMGGSGEAYRRTCT